MSARHQIDSIAFQTIDMGSRVVLGGLAPASHDIDQTVQPAESGSPYAHSHFVVDATERFQFTCKSLATLLENLQLLGPNCVDAATAGDGIDLFAQQLSECATGGRAAGSSHNRVRAAKARLFLRSLAFQGDASGTAQLEGVLLATDADQNDTQPRRGKRIIERRAHANRQRGDGAQQECSYPWRRRLSIHSDRRH